jgi:hypothetical protein|tara:strand:+ start:1826 stop:2005 length:180 start_codon:yes stop_codon:yes gene_type:complete
MNPVPYIEKSVVDYLDSLYPDCAPDLSMEEKLIWFKAGQVAVVRHLKDQYNLQEESKYN